MAFRISKQALRKVFGRVKKQEPAPLPEIKEEFSEEEIKSAEAPEQLKPISLPVERSIRIALPKVYERAPIIKEDVLAKLRTVSETYQLVTTKWKNEKYIVATANIRFNPINSQLTYSVEEPTLDKKTKELINKIQGLLKERLDVDLSKLKAKKEVYLYVDDKVDEILDYLGVRMNDNDLLKVKYFVFRDTIGLGKIESLMRDPNIEDISCDGIGLPLFIFHRNPMYGEMSTNISFDTREELDSFVMRLAQKAGRTVSVAMPLLDASLPDGSRLQLTYGTDIARKGSNFSIRKFFKIPLTPVDLLNYGTADPMLLAYLWLLIEEQRSVLIAGSTAVGKTTFLNTISEFIHPSSKIVSIEDTPEIQLLHTNWTPAVARSGYGPKKYGEVTMFDLLKASLRQRPDFIIVGEIRGMEANVLFHSMATGHPALSTVHADSVDAVIDRLTTRPINLPLAMLENLDVLVFLDKIKMKGKMMRRAIQVIEVEGYDREKQILKTNEVFRWQPFDDSFLTNDSYILAKIAERLNWSPNQVREEILRRASVLRWMQQRNIHNFKDVSQIINLYYVDPKRLAEIMGG